MPLKKIELSSVASITSTASLFSPVSVLKELVENSIDAQSSSITITVDSNSAGLQYIQLRDDGHGIFQEDRSLICKNHTTSKISTDLDIYGVSTLGFRGEALYFINQLTCGGGNAGSKGSMEFSSKSADDKLGQTWKVGEHGDVIGEPKPISMPQGTTITIKNIFAKTPVRYKILQKMKTKNIEKLKQLILCYSVLYPSIRFQLKFINYNKGRIMNTTNDIILNSNIPITTTLTKQLGLKSTNALHEIHTQHLNESWQIKAVLPLMNAKSELSNHKKQIIIISINQRILSHTIGLGKLILKILKNIYLNLDLFTPNVLVLQLMTNDEETKDKIDPNIEPEKNDVLISGVQIILDLLEEKLLGLVSEIHGLKKDEQEVEQVENVEDVNIINSDVDFNSMNKDVYEVNLVEESDDEIENILEATLSKKSNKEPANHDQIEEPQEEEELLELPQQNHQNPITQIKDSIGEEDTTNDVNWSRNMHEKSSSRSTTYESQNQENFEDEHLEISKTLNISNPFTLTNLQKTNKTQDNSGCLLTPDNSVEKIDQSDPSLTIERPRKQVNITSILKPSISSISYQTSQHPVKRHQPTPNQLKRPQKIKPLTVKRLKLETPEYLQSYQLKLKKTKAEITHVEYDDFEDYHHKDREISSSILSFYESLDNVQLIDGDNWHYIGPI